MSRAEGITFATIPLTQSLCESYYGGFANGTLWPLCHCFMGGFCYDDAEYAAYEQVNALFARGLAPLLRPDDLIWVNCSRAARNSPTAWRISAATMSATSGS